MAAVVVAILVVTLALLSVLGLIWWSVKQADAALVARRRAHDQRQAAGEGDGAPPEAPPEAPPVKPWRTRGRNPLWDRQQVLRVPVTAEIHDQLWQLAQRDGVSITDVIADSVVLYRLVRHVGSRRAWPPKHGTSRR